MVIDTNKKITISLLLSYSNHLTIFKIYKEQKIYNLKMKRNGKHSNF